MQEKFGRRGMCLRSLASSSCLIGIRATKPTIVIFSLIQKLTYLVSWIQLTSRPSSSVNKCGRNSYTTAIPSRHYKMTRCWILEIEVVANSLSPDYWRKGMKGCYCRKLEDKTREWEIVCLMIWCIPVAWVDRKHYGWNWWLAFDEFGNNEFYLWACSVISWVSLERYAWVSIIILICLVFGLPSGCGLSSTNSLLISIENNPTFVIFWGSRKIKTAISNVSRSWLSCL